MFETHDTVRIKNGGPEVYTIEAITAGPLYQIELGGDFATRKWVKESDLELVATGNKPDPCPGFVPTRPIMEPER
jgi:hypothetical protein